DGSEAPSIAPDQQPPLALALAPIALPVALIALNTGVQAAAGPQPPPGAWAAAAGARGVLGHPGFALLLSAVIAVATFWRCRRPPRGKIPHEIQDALTSAGVIILITSAGGAFGAMLREAQLAAATAPRGDSASSCWRLPCRD
ncbi:MAG TPA: hypothetical protein PKC18_20160, partial [Lacipirellulaceae bacterium]|nr:hypothetical protein [Lacipirellulaceae bacterium]